MGPEAAFKSALKLIPEADFIINAGVAGSFNPNHEVGSCHLISTVSYPSLPDILLAREGEKLLTSPKPIYDQVRNYGLVDMEGYMLAHIAKRYNKPIELLKVVSDHCNQSSHHNIKQRIDALSDVIRYFVEERLLLKR